MKNKKIKMKMKVRRTTSQKKSFPINQRILVETPTGIFQTMTKKSFLKRHFMMSMKMKKIMTMKMMKRIMRIKMKMKKTKMTITMRRRDDFNVNQVFRTPQAKYETACWLMGKKNLITFSIFFFQLSIFIFCKRVIID